MTVVLVAVYVPIGFLGGLTGALFTEFAFTLVGAVTVSAIIALTLSPMMCSRLLKPHDPNQKRLGHAPGAVPRPDASSAAPPLRAPAARHAQLRAGDGGVRGHRPRQHLLPVRRPRRPSSRRRKTRACSSSSRSSRPERRRCSSASSTRARSTTPSPSIPETDHVFQLDIPGQTIAGMVLKPWDERKATADAAAAAVSAGARADRRRAARAVPAAAAARARSACRCSS